MKNLLLGTLSFCLLLLVGCQSTIENSIIEEESISFSEAVTNYQSFLDNSFNEKYFLDDEMQMISIINGLSIEQINTLSNTALLEEYNKMMTTVQTHHNTLIEKGFSEFFDVLNLSTQKAEELQNVLSNLTTWNKIHQTNYVAAKKALDETNEGYYLPNHIEYRYYKIHSFVEMRGCNNPFLILCPSPINNCGNNPLECNNNTISCRAGVSTTAYHCFIGCPDNDDVCETDCDMAEMMGMMMCDFGQSVCHCLA